MDAKYTAQESNNTRTSISYKNTQPLLQRLAQKCYHFTSNINKQCNFLTYSVNHVSSSPSHWPVSVHSLLCTDLLMACWPSISVMVSEEATHSPTLCCSLWKFSVSSAMTRSCTLASSMQSNSPKCWSEVRLCVEERMSTVSLWALNTTRPCMWPRDWRSSSVFWSSFVLNINNVDHMIR